MNYLHQHWTGARWAFVGLLGILACGCEVDRACEHARLAALNAYESLAQAIAEGKPSDATGEDWAYVEKRVELLESSFATTQVTWRPAEKSQQELKTRLPNLQTDSPARSEILQHTADDAFRRQQEFTQQCK